MTAQSKNRFRVTTYFMALLTIYMTLAMVYYPKDSFDAATIGLQLWWDVVFPALLPFFILSEILMGLGVVHGIGVLLEPLMRPLFKVPGAGALTQFPMWNLFAEFTQPNFLLYTSKSRPGDSDEKIKKNKEKNVQAALELMAAIAIRILEQQQSKKENTKN